MTQEANIEDIERSSDNLDIASRLAMRENQFYVDLARMKKPDQVKDADGNWPTTECVTCDTDIPPARLEATGTIRCVDCQSKLEKFNR